MAIVFAVASFATIGWYKWDLSQNRGYEFGYYGDFNRVSHALREIPGITVTSEWANPDTVLEEFGFEITTNKKRVIQLDFSEVDPVRNLSGAPLARALTELIQTKNTSDRPMAKTNR